LPQSQDHAAGLINSSRATIRQLGTIAGCQSIGHVVRASRSAVVLIDAQKKMQTNVSN
jgi:hypothetical protein